MSSANKARRWRGVIDIGNFSDGAHDHTAHYPPDFHYLFLNLLFIGRPINKRGRGILRCKIV
jgi:hypothetical protein